jgi:hypothetical protein
MHKLHAATDPKRVSELELVVCTPFTSIPAPFAIFGKSALFVTMPWSPSVVYSVPATTRPERECIQLDIAGGALTRHQEA